MTSGKQKLVLPAIQGAMGSWIYYSCLMDIQELSSRVSYADEVHNNSSLSEMIQRRLVRGRGVQISEYLQTQSERFFNSLVVATYGGEPSWQPLSSVRDRTNEGKLNDLSEETVASVGFLTLSGEERLFAVDGQHRLAGIKIAVKEGFDRRDTVSVLFVAHDPKNGLERTRRLFTTLNKTAKPVSKGDIIALDEDDVMAICVRRLIERSEIFDEKSVAYVAGNNMPTTNVSSLTTIGNLYDVLTIIFTGAQSDLRASRAILQRKRPPDDELDRYFLYAQSLFNQLRRKFWELDEYFSAKDKISVVRKFRGSHGGNALFRPIGLSLFARIIARLNKDLDLERAVEVASELPREINCEPYNGLMWNTSRRTVTNLNQVTLREVLLYMLGRSSMSESNLLMRYRRDTGFDEVQLPEKLI